MINPFPGIKEKISLILFYFNKVGNRVEWLRLPNALNTTDCVKIDKKLSSHHELEGIQMGKSCFNRVENS